MMDQFMQHTIFEFFDFIGFWIFAGIIYGGIWIHERWFEKK